MTIELVAGATLVPPDLAPERRPVFLRMVDAARTHGGRLVLVGEAGLGKSFLVDALVRALVRERTVLFVRGRAGGTEPFAGLTDLLAGLPAGTADAVRVQVDLRRREPSVGDGRPGQGAADGVDAAVGGLLAGLAVAGVVVVVDEWQWLDEETLGVLERVLTRPPLDTRVALVAAGRRPATGTRSRSGYFAPDQIVRLGPLRPASLVAVLDVAGLSALPPATLAAVTEDSGGNPLWAMALATARVTGDPRVRPGRGEAELERQRLGALPPDLRRLLATIALMGAAPYDELVQLDPATEAATAEGLRRRLVRTDAGVLTLADPMLARAAVQELTPDAQRALHRSISELPLPLPQRVEHRDRATLPGVDEALATALVRAARRARRTGAPETALRLARRALERTALTDDAYAERAVEAAETALAAGGAGTAAEVLTELDPLTLPLRVFDRDAAALAVDLGRSGGTAAVARRFRALQRVLVPGSGAWEVAEVHRRLASPGEEDGLAAATLPPVLSEDGTPRTLAMVITHEARRRLHQGHGVDRVLLGRVRELAVDGGPLETTADALAARWAYQADDLASSRTGLAAHVRDAKVAGEPYAVVDGLAHSAVLAVLTGHLPAAEAFLREADEQSLALPTLPGSVYRARGVLAVALDDRSGLDRLLNGPLDPVALDRADLLQAALTGLDAAASSAWAEAAVELRRARTASVARGVVEPGRRLWVDVELVRALVQLGRLTEAAEITDALADLGDRPGRVHARGQARRLRALLAWRSEDLPAALRLSELGLSDLHAGGHRPQLVRAQLERVGMLHADGQHVRARGLLADATALAAAIGDPRVVTHAARLDAQVAAHPGRAALTPGELRVAEAVASGQTNRDIAADLFVSVRTVETHLANAYRKLGVHTRTQLALSLNDLPLGGGSGAARRSP
ncbi:LuxR family transcriptional regulator [Microlunatus spumicola]|uniref:LuxR family transcriptional regulator n=1 Tax=Microlunatus spumicola TaxID=81499 RepID=A0ABP6WKG1_9ACTN